MKKCRFLPLSCHEWQVSGPREVFFNVLLLSAISKESSGSLNLKNYDTERDKLVLQIFVNKHKQRMEGRYWCYYSSPILPNI